jgi:hypothetical protein
MAFDQCPSLLIVRRGSKKNDDRFRLARLERERAPERGAGIVSRAGCT